MQRPAVVFLVLAERGHHYHLVWKEGRRLYRLAAGGIDARTLPGSIVEYETASDAVPTATSVVDELAATADFGTTLRVWNVSDHVGRHYPRIRRGEISHGHFDLQENLSIEYCNLGAALGSTAVAARLLFEELESICAVIEPDAVQMTAYGHRLRHLLISACTEVESAWRSVFVANSSNPPARLNTTHYVRLADPMKLRDRRVLFTRVTPARLITPFAGWDAGRPTESLQWYDSYNATKHNREDHLNRATLGHVVDALAALFVMVIAQFGADGVHALPSHPFVIDEHAEFEAERYIQSPFDDGPWHARPLFG